MLSQLNNATISLSFYSSIAVFDSDRNELAKFRRLRFSLLADIVRLINSHIIIIIIIFFFLTLVFLTLVLLLLFTSLNFVGLPIHLLTLKVVRIRGYATVILMFL